MSAYPISELITQSFVEVLGGLLQPPGTSGYNTQLAAVERFIVPFNDPLNLKAVVFDGDEEKIESDPDTPLGHNAWKRRYEVLVYVLTAEGDATPYSQRTNIVRADVEKIILNEIKQGTNFGLNCENILPVGAWAFRDANDLTGIVIELDVYYWTDQYDPYQTA